jgi:cation diffusion facilitator CzcD-associated flavoprotein CzcO
MSRAPAETQVVVIGAGQAGLSVAYHLRRLGLRMGTDAVVLDRGPSTGGAWQHRWAALRLGSAHRVADLPGMSELGISFATADRRLPARDVVRDLYARYEEAFDLRVVRPVEVRAVLDADMPPPPASRRRAAHPSDADRPLLVRATDGDRVARLVVNATGTWGAPFIPSYPGLASYRGRQLHTSGYRAAADLRGLRVLVVGGGTSAIGFLLELEGVAARTLWSTRRPVDFLEAGDLDVEAAVRAVDLQDQAARAGEALPSIVSGTGVPRTRRIVAGIRRGVLASRGPIARFEEDGVVWADGSRDQVDAVIWATGFRPEIRHLAPLGLREKEGGVRVESGVSARDPRVLLAGYGPQASTIGANRAGRRVARQVIAALG